MSSSPKFQGSPLVGERAVLRGEQAASLRPALTGNSDFGQSQTAAAVREAARSEGYAAGWAQGAKAVRATLLQHAAQAEQAGARVEEERAAQLRSAVSALTNAADSLDRRSAAVTSDIETSLVQAAFDIAQVILARELHVATEPGMDAVRRALAVAPTGDAVRVRLNPHDASTLAAENITLSGRDVQLLPDPSIARGDALAECGATRIDASVAAAVQRVKQVLEL